jgi:outer membrane immunogenic protein
VDKHITTGVFAASIAVGSSAYAADLNPIPYRNPPPPPVPVWSWTGFYIGGHFGFSDGKDHWANLHSVPSPSEAGPSVASDSGSGSLTAPVVGGQLGYNYQSGWAVWGVQVDGSFIDIDRPQSANVFSLTLLEHVRDKWLASATGRFGGLVLQDTLLYVKGGAAWAGFRDDVSSVFSGATLLSSFPEVADNRVGWTVGVGAEYHFNPSWSAFVEGNFYDFGTKTVTFPQGTPASSTPLALANTVPFSTDITERFFVVKAGVNFKFW